MGLTCGLWSLIGPAACCVLSYRRDVGGGGALQFISTYESICQDLNGSVLQGLGLITGPALPHPTVFISTRYSHSLRLDTITQKTEFTTHGCALDDNCHEMRSRLSPYIASYLVEVIRRA